MTTANTNLEPQSIVAADVRFTTPETEEYTGVPASTLRYYRHKGIGPKSFKIGSRVCYLKSDLDAWLQSQYDSTVTGGDAA